MFRANLRRWNRPGPRPKIHYLCMVCLVGLSESGVRTHQQDCLQDLERLNERLKERIKQLVRRQAARA